MSSLTAIFGNSEEKTQDSDKLMDLYWNRAELKKEFATMRKEKYRLKDRIKEQEGATARVRQQLDHLESLLTDPDWAPNVMVHFQLRGVARRSGKKLARFAEELKQQRERKRHSSVLMDWQAQRDSELRRIEAQIDGKADQIKLLEDELGLAQSALTSTGPLVRLFRGRSMMKSIDGAAHRLESAVGEQNELKRSAEEISNRKPPDHQGLDIATKRSINLMILSFAQQLYLHFSNFDLAELLKDASDKSAGAIRFGGQYDCTTLLEKLHKAAATMEECSSSVDTLQRRAQMLGESARYSAAEDAVPLASSVARLISISSNGIARESELDLAGRNYWGIGKVFSR